MTLDLLDLARAAERLGVKPGSIAEYRRRDERFPAPDMVLAEGVEVWYPATIDAYAASRPGRGVGGGRPRRAALQVGALVRIPPEMRFGGELAVIAAEETRGTAAWQLLVCSTDPDLAGAEVWIGKEYAASCARRAGFLIASSADMEPAP